MSTRPGMEAAAPPHPPKGNTQTKLKLDGGCKTRNNQGFFCLWKQNGP